MTVTASRLGSAPLTLDWSNFVSVSSGTRGGPPPVEAFTKAWAHLKSRFQAGEVGFYDTPMSNDLSQATECQALADAVIAKGTFTDCLFLGIGGSALGPFSLLNALQDKTRPSLKFHFMDNVDPIDWKHTLSKLRPDSTLVCAVTKSGTTFETMSQLLLALEWLGKDRMKSHVIAITDPAKGDLKAFATREGIPTLHIASSIGGRYSIFSPVGLFAAALSGLSVPQFMQGAKQVRDYIEKTPLEKNPLFILGNELIAHSAKRPIHVCMPYSTRLRSLGGWFVQLWAESLGKQGKGFTPLAAVGATDQHSILQLLRDGPDDKVTWFLTVDQVADEVKIPKAPAFGPAALLANFPAFKILENHTLQELLLIEYRATSTVLTKQGRPNLTFRLDTLDERSLGALYFTFSCLTAITGTLWDVNPFDQPGVEDGKVFIREALSQAGTAYSQRQDEDDNSPVARLRRDR